NFVQRTAEQTILTVVLNVANGTVRAKVTNDEGDPLQFAQVAFVDAATNEVIGGGAKPVEDINGIVELETRADKQVYIVASKPGYANFTSVARTVQPNSTIEFEAALEKEIIQGNIKIDFKGMYKDGAAISVLAPGETYTALFNLRVPANKGYSRIGMHVRTGTSVTMELDKLVLKEINAPGRADILKATSYSPANGYAVDSAHLSSDEAKWANIEWGEFSTGITAVEAEVKVKETATISDEMKLFCRAWAEEDGKIKRDPLDMELGEAESTAGKQALYAKANEAIFQVGTETQCDEKFCFSANVLDVAEGIAKSATDMFDGKVFKNYKLSFTVLNNSKAESDSYMDAELQITNEDEMLLLQQYKVYGAQDQVANGTTAGESTPWLAAGNILPNSTVSGSINFTPQKVGTTLLTISMRSGQRIQFERSVAINAVAEKQFSVVIAPELLPAGIENSVTVTVRDKQSNAEVKDARVKIKDRFGAVISEKTTNKLGIAIVGLPALQPAETVTLIVGKPNYEAFQKTLQVDNSVILVKPATIGIGLNAKTLPEKEEGFSVENKAAFDLRVKSMKIGGRLYGLIDTEKVNNSLYGYTGETIKAGELLEMKLRMFLSEKGKKLEQAKQLDGTLDITVEAYGSEWAISTPLKISIGLGGEVNDPACFSVTRKEWKGSTEGQPIEIEFELQNNCTMEGAPVPLRNVGVTAKWSTNQIGTFNIRTENSAVEVPSGYVKNFIGTIDREQSISVVLQFVPSAGVNGKGVAEITFQAENPTETKSELVSDKIAAEIVAVNLADCIGFSKEVLVIKPEKSDKFAIQTVGCGVKNEIKLESDLTLSTNKLTLGEKDSKEIEVLAEKNMPGQYPINIYAKGSDEQQFKFIKMVRARILSERCIELSRYEFNIFDNPDNPYDGYDTAELLNKCYDQSLTITVKVDERDWGEAMKQGAIIGLITGLLGGIMSSMQGNSFLTGQAPANAAAGTAAASKITTGTANGKPVTLGSDNQWRYSDDSLATGTIKLDPPIQSFTANGQTYQGYRQTNGVVTSNPGGSGTLIGKVEQPNVLSKLFGASEKFTPLSGVTQSTAAPTGVVVTATTGGTVGAGTGIAAGTGGGGTSPAATVTADSVFSQARSANTAQDFYTQFYNNADAVGMDA
ncbi:MAG: hypothetical protein NTW59_04720, partial [Candidatus Diapherotrites archaeon]|nr:hypothetical protein [Candidatus Diapherotrites archaeon]